MGSDPACLGSDHLDLTHCRPHSVFCFDPGSVGGGAADSEGPCDAGRHRSAGRLTVYDWLTVTARLSHLSCLLLAAGVGAAFSRWVANHEVATLQFVKRTLPWVAGVGVVAFVGIQGGRWLCEARAVANLPPAAPDAPNVLIIVVDTLRADHLSSFGYARATSPNIDRLAAQGVLFQNAISTSSWTFPSHASLLTGRYQYEHGMDKIRQMPLLGSEAFSPNGFPTLGEALMQKGYRTGAFSAQPHFLYPRPWFWPGLHPLRRLFPLSRGHVRSNPVRQRVCPHLSQPQ